MKLQSCLLLTLLLTGASAFAEDADPMSALDKTNTLSIGQRVTYSVVEDGLEPTILFVDEQGLLNLPLIGRIPVTSLTYYDLAHQIKAKLEVEYYHKATVLISPYKEDESRGKVFMLGQVTTQAPVAIPKNEILTVTKAILAAGGFTQYADPSTVTILRKDEFNPKNEIKTLVNVKDILEKGDLAKDLTLRANDVVFVPEKGDLNGKVFVVGEIKAPGYYNIPPGKDFTASQAILAAGGFTEFSDQKKIKLVRGDTSLPESEKVLYLDLDKVFKKGDRNQDAKLQNNDMLIIDEKWLNF